MSFEDLFEDCAIKLIIGCSEYSINSFMKFEGKIFHFLFLALLETVKLITFIIINHLLNLENLNQVN